MMGRKFLISASLGLALFASDGSTGAQPFTVRDHVGFVAFNPFEQETIFWSPDHDQFFVVTVTPDLATNSRTFALVLFDVKNLDRGLRAGRTLASFRSLTNTSGIAHPRWVNEQTIAFLGTRDDDPAQLYLLKATGELRRVTSHPTSLTDFAVSSDENGILFEAENVPPDRYEVAKGIVADKQPIFRTYNAGMRYPLFYDGTFFHIYGGVTRPLALPQHRTIRSNSSSSILISPSGRWVVVQVSNISDRDALSYSYPDTFFPSYVLVDLAKSESGPAWTDLQLEGDSKVGFADLLFAWTDDNKGLLVARRTRKGSGQTATFIREYRITDGAYVSVGMLPADATLKSIESRKGGATAVWEAHGTVYRTDFMKRNSRWRALHPRVSSAPREAQVFIRQDINTPPDLFARLPGASAETAIQLTDLNPRFTEETLGTAMVLRWRDTEGHEWQGGLLLPPTYQKGRKYPLVIQTHGFDPKLFWLNGRLTGMTSGYAARALAQRGIVVLQVPDNYSHIGTPQEVGDNIDLITSAVNTLARDGIVDPNRIGIHGSSRSGFVVQAALTTCRFRVAAASVAEADAFSRDQYTRFFGGNMEASMAGLESMWELPPLFGGDSAAAWAEKEPTAHLDRISAPLLMQAYSLFVGEWWDIYAMLRRNERPAEYVYYPDSAHAPRKPLEQFSVQSSVVDWYDFWLRDHEDPDESKLAQYKRWRELREWKVDPQGARPWCDPH